MLSEELRNIYKSNRLTEIQFKQSYEEYCGEYKKWLLEYKNDIISSFIRNKKEVAKSVITSYLTPKRYKENVENLIYQFFLISLLINIYE